MPDPHITITGLDKLYRKLDASTADATIKRAMHAATALLQGRMAKYPPPPTSSSYTRTGTLGRRWATKVEGSGMRTTGFVGNNTEYARYVQDAEKQAKVHQGRWQTVQDQLSDVQVRADVEQIFADESEAAMKGA